MLFKILPGFVERGTGGFVSTTMPHRYSGDALNHGVRERLQAHEDQPVYQVDQKYYSRLDSPVGDETWATNDGNVTRKSGRKHQQQQRAD